MALTSEIKYLLSLVDDDPSNWVVRKETALMLYEAGEYLQAADMVWQTPEIPSTDMDVAFAIKIVSRARPNRAIRMLYELVGRNAGKAPQYIAMANVFNLIGYPMLAMRCYGMAMALNEDFLDMGFEAEAFLYDEGRVLSNRWLGSEPEVKEPFLQATEVGEVEPIIFAELNQELDESSFKRASQEAVKGDVQALIPALEKFNTVQQGEKPKIIAPPVESARVDPRPGNALLPKGAEEQARAPKPMVLPPQAPQQPNFHPPSQPAKAVSLEKGAPKVPPLRITRSDKEE
ncbi:hypothetical protein [Rubritalea tangerina]|uniref:HEAT repeat domain-containing protein n=1 Tax=Rubritalea tangerina TaxID=430798 RepID=A0ABW4ZCT2_9BACT